MKAFVQFCFFLALGCGFASLKAQSPSQVIVANGGVFGSGNYVKIASWNLSTGNYVVFDSFPASSVQDVKIHSRNAYVCADSFVVRYNLDNLTREAIAIVPGARQTAVYKNKVVVTRGFGTANDHAVVLNAGDLSPSYVVNGIVGNCEGVVVVGDTAYVANPNSFVSTTGNLSVVNMSSQALVRNMDLDTLGRQIQDLFHNQNKLYSINIIKFNSPTYSIISEYDIASTTITHHRVEVPASQGAGIVNGKLYADFNGNIGVFDLASGTLTDTVLVSGYWAGMTVDTVNDRLYLTETDFFSYGKLYSYDLLGNRLDSVNVGISPEALAVDYNVVVASPDPSQQIASMAVFPQPFSNDLNIDMNGFAGKATTISLFDLYGRKVLEEKMIGSGIAHLATEKLAQGTYILKAESGSQIAITKVIKTAK